MFRSPSGGLAAAPGAALASALPEGSAGYGLVALKKNVREIEPIALATSFQILID